MPTPPEIAEKKVPRGFAIGFSVKEAAEAFRMLGRAGISAAEAGRNLNRAMSELGRAFDVGPDVRVDSTIRYVSMKGTIRYIRVDIIN